MTLVAIETFLQITNKWNNIKTNYQTHLNIHIKKKGGGECYWNIHKRKVDDEDLPYLELAD